MILVDSNNRLELKIVGYQFEPILRVELLNETEWKLRVYFELECRPNWAPADGAGMDDLWVEFKPQPRDLLAAAASLMEDLDKFRQRGSSLRTRFDLFP